ncbi:unnamed protein product [Thlaspi arvense]|uniref:SHSP domain-containing protein n=1 Tax=Thlaspi arvense TaxID=13288 RepID=A0AAU9RLF0_THLAR|nr:unnamed protein product [Thlaspi arvense]
MSKAGRSAVNDRDRPKHFPPIPRNRFQKTGNPAAYEWKETKNAFVMRVDMPGSSDSDLVYGVEGSNVYFFANDPALPGYKHDGRKFGGAVAINRELYDVNQAKAKLLNGVLWISVPKIPAGKKAELHVVEKMVDLKITRADAV